VRSASRVAPSWLASHTRVVRGKTVLTIDGKHRILPRARPAALKRGLV
jgi:hypothetical protein